MGAREHYVAEWVLAAVAILLTAVVVTGSPSSRTNSPQDPPAADPPAAAPDSTAVPSSTVQAKPRTNNAASTVQADFEAEAGLAGWRPIGPAGIGRDAQARQGRWAARFDGVGTANQGMALPAVLRCRPGHSYAARVWVRANRPGALLEVNLVESLGGRRYATDSVGMVLGRGEWRQVEVTHRAHRPNATLTLEIVLPRGSPAATILVDDLEVTVHKASFMSSG